jgi:predicted phage tail component-like protein
MSTTDLTLDGVALSTAVPGGLVVRPIRPLVGERRHEFVTVPGRAGTWKFPEEPGDRVLEFEIDILGDTFEDRRAQVRALADWCDLGRTANLIISDEPDRYHVAILDNDADPDEWLVRAQPVLRFRCDPYALATTLSTEEVAVAGAGVDSGTFSVPDDIAGEPIFEITPNDGTITGFTLTVNEDALSYAGPTIASGNTVTVSTISDTVTIGTNGDTMLTGAYDAGNVAMALVSGSFPLLVPGNNDWSISWTGTATDITIDVTWRERFR